MINNQMYLINEGVVIKMVGFGDDTWELGKCLSHRILLTMVVICSNGKLCFG